MNYYRIRRWIDEKISDVRRFIQKGRQGYPNFAVWDVGYYLVPLIYEVVKKFKESDRNGFPVLDGDKLYNDMSQDERIALWETILDEIVAGLKCGMELHEENYWDEIPKTEEEMKKEWDDAEEYLVEHPDACLHKSWLSKTKRILNKEKYDQLSADYEKGMALLGKHIFRMWD